MNSINVVVVTPAFDRTMPTANQETLRQISLVSPQISASDVSALAADQTHKLGR